MKLTVILLFGSMVAMSASTYSQNTKLNLTTRNSSLMDIFRQIEDQSEFYFYFKKEDIKSKEAISVELKDANITEILDQILAKTGLEYKIIDRYIVVKEKGAADPKITMQQVRRVTGKVTDSSGASIPGVSVVIKGTSTGVNTDTGGGYSVPVNTENAILQFSFVGMKMQEVAVGGKTTINVSLAEETVGIEEVVAIGYGVAKKSDLTGSVASVSSKNFENQPISNMSSALQGRAAGVAISNVSGAPGGSIRIRIRGANSVTGGNDPLYVVDGMQLTSFSLNDLNPADVENIEILKDASATAIYGSRGANGVILITSKKGKTERAKIDFTANYGIANRSYKYNLLDPVSYANQVNLYVPNAYSPAYIAQLKNGGGTDWQDAIFQTGKTQDYQISASGSTQKSSYYVSGRYVDQTGIVINSNYKRYSFHSNLESKITDKITLSVAAFLNRGEGFNNQTIGSLRGGVEQALIWGPAEPVYLADGSYNLGDKYGSLGPNPVANLKASFQESISNSALLNTKLTYKIWDFLTLDIMAGMDANLSEWNNINSRYAPYGVISAARNYNNSMGLQNSNVLTFHKVMGGIHDLSVTGVFEQSKGSSNYTSVDGSGSAFTENLLYYALGTMTDKNIGSGYSMSRLRSYVGRINYILNNKYLLTASYRADGSSKFPNNKWGYFPSAALSWRLSEEAFIKNINLFSNLKIRGGWGITGNQGVNPFATIPQMSTGNYAYGTNSGLNSSVSNQIGDPNLKWEQTTQADIGFDMGFFKNRLNLSADYFDKQTKDLLLRVPIPEYGGSGSKLANVGSVENKGVELVLSGLPVDHKDFTWNVGLNFSSYRNKVVKLGGGATFINSTIQNLTGGGIVTNEFVRNIVGESMATFWGNKFLGIWQESEATEAALYGHKPGDNKYLDINADHKIDGNDKMVIGHSLPNFSWGVDNTVRFKNLELNVFIIGVNGNDIFNMDYALASTIIGDSRTITNAEVNSWTPQNKNNNWPSLLSKSNTEIIASSKWLQDGSFIRIKNVSLTYRIPSSIIKGAPLKLGISAQNLFTLTKYKGYDPEASSGGGDDINQGVVSGAYPSAREFTFSLKYNF